MGLALAAALGASACGGGESDEDKVRDVINRALTLRDPDDCTKVATQRFLEQTELNKGREAVRSCRESAEEQEQARSVAIHSVEVDGSEADARFAARGGVADGQTFTVTLVEQDGDWKLDRVTALALDREKFDRAQREALTRGRDAVTGEEADCIIERLGRTSDGQLARAFVESDASVFLGPLGECVGDAPSGDRGGGGELSRRRAFEALIRRSLNEEGVPKATADCILRRLRRMLTDAEIKAAIAGERRELNEAARRAGAACAEESGSNGRGEA